MNGMLKEYKLVDPLVKTKYASHDSPRAVVSRRAHPSYGWCLRCGFAKPDRPRHAWVQIDSHTGISPTCRNCWEVSGLEERIELCRALFRGWLSGHLCGAYSRWILVPENHREWMKIERAVREQFDK